MLPEKRISLVYCAGHLTLALDVSVESLFQYEVIDCAEQRCSHRSAADYSQLRCNWPD